MRLITRASDWIDAGIETGDRVATWSENRWEWIVWDWALQGVGACTCRCTPPCHHRKSLVWLTTRVVAGCLYHRTWLPARSTVADSQVLELLPSGWTWDISLPARDRDAPATAEALFARFRDWRERQTSPDEMTTLLYTSGTTGEPKGVMLSQTNLVANVEGKLGAIELFPDDIRYALLPMTHIFARTCDLATWGAAGCRLIVGSGKEHWFDEIRETRPTYINAVPLFYQWCWRQAAARDALHEPGSLRAILGDRIRVCNCGGAPLPDAVYDWFVEQQVTLITGYGLTETSPVITSSSPGRMKRGAVGRPLSNVEVRLADDGEVMARGPSIMLGYYRQEEMTREVLSDGWFSTGDLGRLDSDGFLTLVGRKKELIVTPGGLKIVPSEIERRLVDLEWVSQAYFTGDVDGRPCGLLVVQQAALENLAPRWAEQLSRAHADLEASSPRSVDRFILDVHAWSSNGSSESSQWDTIEGNDPGPVADEETRRLASQLLAATDDLPKYCWPWRVVLTLEPFSMEEGTLTAKGSLRRQEIAKRRNAALAVLLRSRGSVSQE
ncbi:MAG: AMP-binding protein [Pirellulaceae bacterium]